ncbi:HIT domain-containing protein [Pirellulales bacterium]|nr:HIT domain-containing protein [Pirellulales bacterium]
MPIFPSHDLGADVQRQAAVDCQRSTGFTGGASIVDEQRIWAPWRIGYIAGDSSPPPPLEPTLWRAGAKDDCFLCRSAAEYSEPQAARNQLVIERTDSIVAVLNRFPYCNGHLLISPARHAADLQDLEVGEHRDLMESITRWTAVLREMIQATGFNIGLNLGAAAGAGVPGHLHWHVVPRWPGDANFMPVTAGVRVLPQSLDSLWEALTERMKS